jgi:hypothetical protein
LVAVNFSSSSLLISYLRLFLLYVSSEIVELRVQEFFTPQLRNSLSHQLISLWSVIING